MLKTVRDDLGVSTDAIVTTNMAAVGRTVLMRLAIGWLCDLAGPRLTCPARAVLCSPRARCGDVSEQSKLDLCPSILDAACWTPGSGIS